MKRRSNPILITLFFIIAASDPSFAQNPWHRITDNEAGFSISFPGEPTYQTSTDPVTGMQSEVYKFFLTGRLLRITFGPLPAGVRTPADIGRIYGELSQRVIPPGSTLLSQQKLTDGGRQYDTVADDGQMTIYGRTRLYIYNSRYYAIAFEMYAKDGLNAREAERFLSSFRFLNTRPNGKATKRTTLPSVTATKGSAKARWYSLRSPDGGFIVEFPGKPTYQADSSLSAASTFHRYHYFYGENIYQVSYREIPAAITQPDQVLRQAVEAYSKSHDGRRVLRQERLPDGGYLIESRGISDSTPFYSRTRLYVRGSRVYYVTTLTQNITGPNNSDVARFFASFRLL